MKTKRFRTVADITSWRLCMGCGACVSACPENNIQLLDIRDQGLRPIVNSAKCQKCGECVKVCPGIEVSHKMFNNQTIPQLRQAWGPILEIWEGYATDSEIRYKGSSGGAATALALFCLEQENFSGVLHIGTKPEIPLRNVPVFSRNRAELLARTGSRYSPAAPCEKFDWIEQAESNCVFIGKPCDVVALRKSQAINPALNRKVGLAISIFCAGTPNSNGTKQILNDMEVDTNQVSNIKYRGNGWPGETKVTTKGPDKYTCQMPYERAWGQILSHYVPLRCRLCPDGTGEFADISCGDPWHREIKPGETGRSLVLVRTARGREVLRKAMEAGYVEMEKVRPAVLPASQQSLLKKRRMLFGRLLGMRMMFIPTPRFKGFSLLSNWRQLSWSDKLRSVLGTLRRIVSRGWLIPMKAGRDILIPHTESSAHEIISVSLGKKP